MNVEVRIERLVLDGLPLRPGERAALAGALGDELRLLVETRGVPAELMSGGAVPRLTAPLAAAAPGTDTPGGTGSPLGRAIARSVFTSLGTTTEAAR